MQIPILFRPLAAVSLAMLCGCSTPSSPTAELTLVNATVYRAPGEAPLQATNLAITDGLVTAIYDGVPLASRQTIDVEGRTVTAGLWNSHVHFTDPGFSHASEALLRDMFLKYGFTTVMDTGSDLDATLALKARIESGDLPGPNILTVNGSFVYRDGTPSYLPDIRLPEIVTPDEAEPLVVAFLESGADGIKIFSGSFQGPQETIHLPPAVIRAIADAAHARGSFVFSHPTDRRGFVNAVDNGVDVLAHTAPQGGPLGEDLVGAMKSKNVALIPTLKLWRFELLRAGLPEQAALAYQRAGVGQLAEYVAAGGEIIFGTDIGFIDDFDTAEEFRLMSAAGMTFDDILASMTTNPARRFSSESGRLEVGAPADIVVFGSDPAADVAAFADVAYTIKSGRVVYRRDD